MRPSIAALRRIRLLPRDNTAGWTPYAWLFYLPSFLIEPIARTQAGRADALYWGATAAGLLVFLITYFRAYWVRGVQLLPIIAVQLALALAFSPVNVGACVLFVYAGAIAARLDRTRDAVRTLLAVVALAAASALVIGAPLFFWITGVAITLLVGGVNLHDARLDRARYKLRFAQDEIEHLAAVAERERIARDLHDVLGHTLSLIVLKAELAVKLAGRDSARAVAEMRDVEAVARGTLQDVRQTIRGYRPTLADETARARAMLKAAGIAGAFELAAPALPQVIEETLALALRESVTNVVRHSGASTCRARLHRDAKTATLEIEDNGRGSAAPDGAGLRGMRERVEAFGGELVRSQGRGMTLKIVLPLTDSVAPVPRMPRRDVAG